MRPQQHRYCRSTGLDQILPTEGQQTATDEGHIACAEIRCHLAHAVAQQHLAIFSQRLIGTATLPAQTARPEQGLDAVKACGMARHDHQ